MPDSNETERGNEPAKENQMTIENFVAVAQEVIDVHMAANFPTLPRPVLTIAKGGRKYAKIVRTDSQASVHCFVEKETGTILKAASWSTPAKGARGNISDADGGRSAVTPYGAKYR
jgi:hypothetical protein